MVATFLALLELMKSGRVRLNDDGDVEVTDYRSLTDEELAEADRAVCRTADRAGGRR